MEVDDSSEIVTRKLKSSSFRSPAVILHINPYPSNKVQSIPPSTALKLSSRAVENSRHSLGLPRIDKPTPTAEYALSVGGYIVLPLFFTNVNRRNSKFDFVEWIEVRAISKPALFTRSRLSSTNICVPTKIVRMRVTRWCFCDSSACKQRLSEWINKNCYAQSIRVVCLEELGAEVAGTASGYWMYLTQCNIHHLWVLFLTIRVIRSTFGSIYVCIYFNCLGFRWKRKYDEKNNHICNGLKSEVSLREIQIVVNYSSSEKWNKRFEMSSNLGKVLEAHSFTPKKRVHAQNLKLCLPITTKLGDSNKHSVDLQSILGKFCVINDSWQDPREFQIFKV